jgi:hypothetical protein
MSQHVAVREDWPHKKFVFGWDQPLMSFYFQVHDMTRPEDDEENPRIVFWAGATVDTPMYEVENLVNVARQQGLVIDLAMQTTLYRDKDDGV